MREGNSFTLCVSPHLDGGGGVHTFPGGGEGGTYLSRWGGVPTFPGLDRGVPRGGYLPSQVWMAGAYLPRSGWAGTYLPRQGGTYLGRGYPPPGKGYPLAGVPLQQGVTPPSRLRSQDGGYPLPEQHSVYLLRGGQCASCIHTGGLSCLYKMFNLYEMGSEAFQTETETGMFLKHSKM